MSRWWWFGFAFCLLTQSGYAGYASRAKDALPLRAGEKTFYYWVKDKTLYQGRCYQGSLLLPENCSVDNPDFRRHVSLDKWKEYMKLGVHRRYDRHLDIHKKLEAQRALYAGKTPGEVRKIASIDSELEKFPTPDAILTGIEAAVQTDPARVDAYGDGLHKDADFAEILLEPFFSKIPTDTLSALPNYCLSSGPLVVTAPKKATFTDAAAYCRSQGGRLPNIYVDGGKRPPQMWCEDFAATSVGKALPVLAEQGGKKFRYVWTGRSTQKMEPVSIDGKYIGLREVQLGHLLAFSEDGSVCNQIEAATTQDVRDVVCVINEYFSNDVYVVWDKALPCGSQE